MDKLIENLEETADKETNKPRVITGLRDLRYGLFADADAVNALLDELIEIMEGWEQ